MYCPKCGKEVPSDAVFCPYCGGKTADMAEEKPKKPAQKRAPAATNRPKRQQTNQMELFSKAVPARTIRLFGEDIVFPSCYFIEDFTKTFFQGKISALGENIERELRALDITKDKIELHLRPITLTDGMDGDRVIREFAKTIGLNKATTDAIGEQYELLVNVFSDRVDELGQLFVQADLGVDDMALRGEYRKATRPRVQSYGFGVSGLAKAAVTQSVINAGTGLAYSALNKLDVSLAKKQAKDRKMSLLEECIKVIRSFFDEGDNAVPALCLEIIKDRYPASVWTRDAKQVSDLKAAYSKADDAAAQRHLCGRLLYEDPHGRSQYERCFSLLAEEPLEAQFEDLQSILSAADWFNVSIKRARQTYSAQVAEKTAQAYRADDMRRYETLTQFEQALGVRSEAGEKLYSEYPVILVDGITDYRSEEVSSVLSKIGAFAEKYACSSDAAVEKLTDALLAAQGIRLEDVDPAGVADIRSGIEKAAALEKEYSKLGFPAVAKSVKRRVKQAEAQLDQLRHVQEPVDYDPQKKEFTRKELVLDRPEEVQAFQQAAARIEELCGDLHAPSTEKDEKTIEKMRALCLQTGYCARLTANVRYQYDRQQKQAKQVGAVEYSTRDEAALARKELDIIRQVYEENGKNDLETFSALLQRTFRTESAKQDLAEREQRLLKRYAEKGETMPGAVTKTGAKIVGFFLLALAGSAAGIFMVLRLGWVLKIIGVGIFVAGWEKFIETVRDSGEDISDARIEKEIAADFRSAFDKQFVIVNGHIQKRQ